MPHTSGDWVWFWVARAVHAYYIDHNDTACDFLVREALKHAPVVVAPQERAAA